MSCQGLSQATPVDVMQTLRNLEVPVGTSFGVLGEDATFGR